MLVKMNCCGGPKWSIGGRANSGSDVDLFTADICYDKSLHLLMYTFLIFQHFNHHMSFNICLIFCHALCDYLAVTV